MGGVVFYILWSRDREVNIYYMEMLGQTLGGLALI